MKGSQKPLKAFSLVLSHFGHGRHGARPMHCRPNQYFLIKVNNLSLWSQTRGIIIKGNCNCTNAAALSNHGTLLANHGQ